MADPSDIVERLAQHRTLSGVPRAELEWLAARGRVHHMEPGDLLTNVPEMLEALSVLFSGRFAIYVDHGAGQHKVMEWVGGDVTGYLPYSRMSGPAIGEVVVEDAIDQLWVSRVHFAEMIRECPFVTTKL